MLSIEVRSMTGNTCWEGLDRTFRKKCWVADLKREPRSFGLWNLDFKGHRWQKVMTILKVLPGYDNTIIFDLKIWKSRLKKSSVVSHHLVVLIGHDSAGFGWFVVRRSSNLNLPCKSYECPTSRQHGTWRSYREDSIQAKPTLTS